MYRYVCRYVCKYVYKYDKITKLLTHTHVCPTGGGSRATDRRRQESGFDLVRILALLPLLSLLGGNPEALTQLTGFLQGTAGDQRLTDGLLLCLPPRTQCLGLSASKRRNPKIALTVPLLSPRVGV